MYTHCLNISFNIEYMFFRCYCLQKFLYADACNSSLFAMLWITAKCSYIDFTFTSHSTHCSMYIHGASDMHPYWKFVCFTMLCKIWNNIDGIWHTHTHRKCTMYTHDDGCIRILWYCHSLEMYIANGTILVYSSCRCCCQLVFDLQLFEYQEAKPFL